MNPGLRYLVGRTLLGRLRWLGRQARTPKGAVSLGAALLYLGVVAVPTLHVYLTEGGGAPSETMRQVGPLLVVAAALLLGLDGGMLAFTPSEVDFLFAAPLTRRELLLYHLASRLATQLFTGLLFFVFLLPVSGGFGAALLGAVLGQVLVFTAAQAVGVASHTLRLRLGSGRYRALAWGGAAALGVGLWATWRALPAGSLEERTMAFLHTPLLQALGLPGRAPIELLASTTLLAGAGWAALTLALIAAVVAAVLAADASAVETAQRASAKRAERLQRMRTGGALAVGAPTALRVRLPELRFLGPAAALARRQLLEVVRRPRAFGGVAAFTALMTAAMLLVPRLGGGPASETAPLALFVAIGYPLFFGGFLPFDFRGDLDRMAYLRALPLPPRALVVGQLFTAWLMLLLLQYAGVAAVALVSGAVPQELLLSVVLALPAVTAAVLLVENIAFLLAPYRLAPGAEQLQHFGRNIVMMMAKMLTLAALALPVVAAGALARHLSGGSLLAGVAVGLVVLSLLCLPMTRFAARAFLAFDVSRDVPT